MVRKCICGVNRRAADKGSLAIRGVGRDCVGVGAYLRGMDRYRAGFGLVDLWYGRLVWLARSHYFSAIKCSFVKEKVPYAYAYGTFLELLSRFELETSSLPRMRSTD